ncbi:MAG TPA: tetratricopeptide repeat protein [Stellaceae bacterium]|nr:tetratricopeptide repeat protein [Stellaceae bacterium]
MRKLRRLEAALADYGKAISIRPDHAEAYNNRGNALQELQRLDAAAADYTRAIAIRPDYADAYWNKAFTALVQGDYATGFKLYEWRWKVGNFNMEQRCFAQPLWLGDAPLQSKKILLHSEQGLGDTIQFCRYASLAAVAGAEVFLQVPRSLASLLKDLEGASLILTPDDPLPDFDYHCPLLSLPLAFKTVVGTIPHPTSYLHADPAKARTWQERIGERNKPKIGVVWSGGFRANPLQGWGVIGESRNIPLDRFARTLSGIDADFFSLQKGDPAESEIRGRESEYWPLGNLHNFAAELTDFSDTAALMANLDLIVSVDTAAAHLAAALGKSTWILNRFDTDWRWLLYRDDSPWYRSVKLYRQDESQRWEPVLQRVAAELTTRANDHRAIG